MLIVIQVINIINLLELGENSYLYCFSLHSTKPFIAGQFFSTHKQTKC